MADVMAELVGEDQVERDVPVTSEDFGFMLQALPGAYGFIGNGGVSHSCENLHNAGYDFNDDILGLGVTFWALTRRWFSRDR